MKLTTRKDITLDDDYVDIRYRKLTPEIQQIFQLCENANSVLLCEKDNTMYKVDINDVLYIEAVDRKTCVYTEDDVFIISTTLAQLEKSLNKQHFIRISRMALLNIYKVKSISNGINFRLTAEMVNDEKIIINRSFRRALLEAIQQLAEEVTE